MGKRVERWAVIFNLFGPQTIGEGLVSCAWEAPPDIYSPEAEDRTGVARAVTKALRDLRGRTPKDAEDQAVAAYGVTPPGALRLEKGQEAATANGKAVVLIGAVALAPATLGTSPNEPAERIYVRVSDIICGGNLPFLYPAELGTHAEYLARYERYARGVPTKDRLILWSTPCPLLPVAA